MAATKKTENPDVSTMNVYAKLLAVRSEFYENGAKKTGKNLHAEFMYFELEDPECQEVQRRLGGSSRVARWQDRLSWLPQLSGSQAERKCVR